MSHRLPLFIVVSGVIALGLGLLVGSLPGAWALGAVTFVILLLTFLVMDAAQEVPGSAEEIGSVQPTLPVGFGRAILERVPSPLMVISDKGRITYANTAAMQLLPSILVGDHFAALVRAPVFIEAVKASLQDGQGREVEFSLPGQERQFEAQVTRLPAGSEFGDDRQAIVRIEDRTEAYLIAEMRSNFVANASHELRTPLASLLGYIETIREHGRDDPDAQDRFLGIMEKQARRMQRLVDDLMSLSRIEMAANEAPDEQGALHDLIKEAVAAILPVAVKAGTEVHVDLDGPGPMIFCDRDQIIQVMTNLLDNAIHYGNGEIRISLAEPDPVYPGMVGISIADNGDGIARADLPRLTERFFRVNVARSRESGGTGLGLAIVKHILNRHSGDLSMVSDIGKGSVFSVWLPVEGKTDSLQAVQSVPLDNAG